MVINKRKLEEVEERLDGEYNDTFRHIDYDPKSILDKLKYCFREVYEGPKGRYYVRQ